MQFSTILQLYKVIHLVYSSTELLAILDRFFTIITSDYIGVVGSHEVARKNTRQVVTPPYGPIGAVDNPKSSQING